MRDDLCAAQEMRQGERVLREEMMKFVD